MNREGLATSHLTEAYDNVIVLASRYVDGRTECFRFIQGNAYAVQGMLDEQMQMIFMGGIDGEAEGEEEEGSH